jgi:hypothetical protein
MRNRMTRNAALWVVWLPLMGCIFVNGFLCIHAHRRFENVHWAAYVILLPAILVLSAAFLWVCRWPKDA